MITRVSLVAMIGSIGFGVFAGFHFTGDPTGYPPPGDPISTAWRDDRSGTGTSYRCERGDFLVRFADGAVQRSPGWRGCWR
jgi:hypothetical protein